MRILLLSLSYLVVFSFGLGAGVYLLPILSAPPAPTHAQVQDAARDRMFTATFRRDAKGSDLFHWGDGHVTITRSAVVFDGRLAPGPAYKLYLVPGVVDSEEGFRRVKAQSLQVGDIRTFENFIVPLAPGAALESYETVLVWCESFSRFITAAKYR